ISFPLLCQNMRRGEIRERVEETARLLRIDHLLDRRVSGLSGGDRQRVALGRAIVRRPAAFLMDEPLGALDSEFRHLMCGELRDLHDRIGATTVYVTHDQLEAMSMADRIAVMNRGEVEQGDAPQDIYDRPVSFLHFTGGVASGSHVVRLGEADIEVPTLREDRAASTALALGVRPEHIMLDDAAPLRGRIFGAEYLGTTQIVIIDTAHGQV